MIIQIIYYYLCFLLGNYINELLYVLQNYLLVEISYKDYYKKFKR